jgi:hypothetical protein
MMRQAKDRNGDTMLHGVPIHYTVFVICFGVNAPGCHIMAPSP